MIELLVVDDEEDICWALRKGLTGEGVNVTPVERGEDAIREVMERRFDAAVIDVKLPGKSGIDISRILRQLAPWLPVLIMSGYHYEQDPPIQEGLRRGEYEGFINKPFELDHVVSLLRRAVLKRSRVVPSGAP